ncbi:MAG TPA: hypothetical protein VNA17_11545, partial [Pyrinomonadaceae bacterium]|nr:hypothetical protein [Pyrinomonadaceae bacterium]
MLNKLAISAVLISLFAVYALAQGTGFTYQGHLKSTGAPASGNHDFQFSLWDAATGGTQVGATLTLSSVTVTNGAFAATLEFGNQFPGLDRFLEVRVRPTGAGASFTILTPREQIKAVPYAIKSLHSENSQQLGGVAATQYVTLTTGGANFIANTTSPQASSNFNISGTGVIGTRMSVGTPVKHPQAPQGFQFTVGGLQPSVVGGNGTNAVEAVGVRGGKGGNTSGGSGTVGGRG